ncbi:hypothetical protein ACHAWF_008296 [Thalassiosira exigua]
MFGIQPVCLAALLLKAKAHDIVSSVVLRESAREHDNVLVGPKISQDDNVLSGLRGTNDSSGGLLKDSEPKHTSGPAQSEDPHGKQRPSRVQSTATGFCCAECDNVWNSYADSYTCGARIQYKHDHDGLSWADACSFISNEQSNVCGPCSCSSQSSSPKVTVKNNCGSDFTVVVGGSPARACNDEDCSAQATQAMSNGQNIQLSIGPNPFDIWSNNNFGAATLAELMVMDGGVWADISRVSGFNKGVTIKDDAGGWRLTCNDVNCNDAYWLCDNAFGNPLFSPNDQFATTALTITFCPNGEENTNYFESANKCGDLNPRRQAASTSAPYICQWNSGFDISQSGTCVTGTLSSDGKYCQNANPRPVTSCNL